MSVNQKQNRFSTAAAPETTTTTTTMGAHLNLRLTPRLALLGVFNPEWAREIHWDDDMNHVYALHVSATEVKETGKKFLGKYFLYGNKAEWASSRKNPNSPRLRGTNSRGVAKHAYSCSWWCV